MVDNALKRILYHAHELRCSDYRAEMANWKREYEQLMARKPEPPEDFKL